MNQNISTVKTVCFSINYQSNPPQLTVNASGFVNSIGWMRGALHPRVYVTQPQDGIQDFDFIAESPIGVVVGIISAISGDGSVKLESWMKGVRVHSAINSITALLSEATIEFDGYHLNYYSDPNSHHDAQILLSYKTKSVALLLFVKTRRYIPVNAIGGVGLPVIHFSISKFSTILDIIRNEKPLFVYLRNGKGEISSKYGL